MVCIHAHERVAVYLFFTLLETFVLAQTKAQSTSFGSLEATDIENGGLKLSENEVDLQCHTSSMCMHLNKEWLAVQWGVTSLQQLSLRRRCDESAEDDETEFVLCTQRGKLSSCGSEFSQNNTHAFFTNNVHILRSSSLTELVPTAKASIPWTCTYPLKLLLGLRFTPQISPKTIFLGNHAGYGVFEAAMYLYKDENFKYAYDSVPQLHVSDRLRVKIELLRGPTTSRLRVVRCWGSSVPTPDDETSMYTIIDDYCPTVEGLKADVKLRNNGDSQYVLWESNIFRFVFGPEVYVHCRVKVCFEESKCEKKCSEPLIEKRRRRREAMGDLANQLVTIGPITVESDVPGIVPARPQTMRVEENRKASLKGDSKETKILGMSRVAVYAIIAVLATACVLLTVGVSVGIYRKTRLQSNEKIWESQTTARCFPSSNFTSIYSSSFKTPISVPNTIADTDRMESGFSS